MKIPALALSIALAGLLAACRAAEPAPPSTADARDAVAEAAPAERPEIRYYVIADT